MKKIITLTFLLASTLSISQILENAPWTTNNVNTQRNSNPTLEEVSTAAEAYFSTIDVEKKGSGYKPFKRWQYNWSRNLNADGTIKSKESLLNAWRQKKELNQSTEARADLSNWTPLGPYTNSNTYNATNAKQTGQGRVNAIAVDPSDSNTYYVGTPAGGLWKSTNAGLDWSPLTDELPQIGVSGIAIHPTDSNIIYIATGDDDASDSYSVGVWKSTDGGTSWNPTGAIPGEPNSMNEIFINPNDNETIMVATSTGVHKSTDGGNFWTTVLSEISTQGIRDLKMKPNDPTTWYAVSNNSFYKSTNNGDSFSEITLPNLGTSSRLTMGVTSANNNYVYVVSAGNGSTFNGFYKSTNSGNSFTKSTTGSMFGGSTQAWYDLALTVSSNNPEIVYVGVLDIYKSTNGGLSFTRLNFWDNPNQNSYTHADIHFMRFIDGKFFAGTDGGIYVSTDEGLNFTDLTKNLAISQFYRISVSQQNYQAIAGGLQDNGGFGYKNGEWRNYHGADGMEGIVDPNNENKYYGFIQYGAQLHITENSGESRTSVINPPSGETHDFNPNTQGGAWVTPLAINNDGELYAGYNSLYKLVGNAWSLISTGSNGNFGGDLAHIEIDPNNNDNIYVARSTDLYRSTDRGVNFERLGGISVGNITSIEVSNSDSNTIWLTGTSGVIKSTNILASFPTSTNISGNLPLEPKLIVKHHLRSGNNTIYVGTALGVYFINDDESEWQTFDTGLPNTQVIDLAINEEDSKLIAATYGRGVFMSDIPRQLPPNDIRLISINNPTNGINCNNNVTPEITIKNQGVNTLTTATINYKIDNGATESFNWTGNLDSEQTTNVNLPELNNLTIGVHTLEVETTISNDAFQNNKGSANFSININNTTPLSVNTFESSDDELLIGTTNSSMWMRGNVTKTLLNNPVDSNAYATNTRNNYPNQTTGYLYTNCYDLSSISNPELAFKMAFDIEEDWDYMVVEYSTDFGANWETLGTANDPNWYNSSSTANGIPGNQWTGEGEDINPNDNLTNATVRDYSYDLAPLTNEANIVFRFKFVADAEVNEEGVVIDNLVINGVLSTDSFSTLNNIAIYPNPSESIFNINWNTSEALNIRVFDITGKQVFTKKNITDNSYQLDLDGYAQGIYLLNMNMNGKTATKKIILK